MCFIATLLTKSYVTVGILRTCGKYLHDSIILLRGEVLVNNNVPVPSQETERTYVLGVSVFASNSTICLLECGTVGTVRPFSRQQLFSHIEFI